MNKLVILLHGVGSEGSDLAALGTHWTPALPGIRFASPDAPQPFDGGVGFQWFSLTDVTPHNRPARVLAARAPFDALLTRLFTLHDVTPDRVVLVGFSQGAIMALDALASGRWPLAGVVAFSGRLATETLTPAPQTPALLIHGHADEVVPWTESETAMLRLKAAGVSLETQFEPATGHTISAQGAARAAAFIDRCLNV